MGSQPLATELHDRYEISADQHPHLLSTGQVPPLLSRLARQWASSLPHILCLPELRSGVIGIVDYGPRNNKSEMWDVFKLPDER